VERFSLGFGKTLWSRYDRYGTEWRIAALPIGGYVRFAGDQNAASVPDQDDLEALRAAIIAREGPGAEKKYFAFKPLWQRALVVLAGPVANFILAIVLFAGLLMTFGEFRVIATVGSVLPGSPAAHAGFQPGDTIVSANGVGIDGYDALQNYVMVRTGVPIDFVVRRGGSQIHLEATPVDRISNDEVMGRRHAGAIGVASAGPSAVRHVTYGPIQALGGGVRRTWDILKTTGYYLSRMVRGQVSGDQLGGPIGTAQLAGAVARAGAQGAPNLPVAVLGATVNLISFAAFFSVGVGFLNLLPIPVLDGGHLAFYAYEAAARRPLPASVQALSYRVGLALVVGLMLFATTNDLRRNNVFHFLGGPFS
jgi:regulator of sigma E protease